MNTPRGLRAIPSSCYVLFLLLPPPSAFLSSSSTAVATTGVRSRRRQNGRDRAAPSSDGATLSLASYRSRAHSLLHDPRPSPRGPSETRRARAALRPPLTERLPRPRTSSEALWVVGHSRLATQSRTLVVLEACTATRPLGMACSTRPRCRHTPDAWRRLRQRPWPFWAAPCA